MPQVTDWSIDRASGLAVRAQMNGINEAVQSCSSGPTAPSPTVAGMLWFDTGVSPPVLRQRNAANTAWNRLIDTTDVAASRAALSVPPFPTISTGFGQWVLASSASTGAACVLPSGATWAYFMVATIAATGAVRLLSVSVQAGGTNIYQNVGDVGNALCWRIS